MRERVRDALAEKSGPVWDAVRDDLLSANISIKRTLPDYHIHVVDDWFATFW